jgi:hypothetical protein
MTQKKMNLHDGRTGSALAIRITPRASRSEIAEIMNDGTIKVRLTTSSHAEEANQALVQFLAQVLQVAVEQVEVVAGQNGKDKLVSIINLPPEKTHERILKHLA